MANHIRKIGALSLSASFIVLGAPALAGNSHYPTPPSLIPSNPEAGECYARVQIPARHERRGQSVVVQDGYTQYQVEQPQIRSRTEQVMVKEPSVEYRVRQPRYTTVTEQIMTRPAYEKLRVSPPEFHTISETVQVSSPRLVWKKGNPATLRSQGYVIHSTADGGRYGQGYSSTVDYGAAQNNAMHCGATCEIWCLVEEPGQSVSYNRRVLKNPSMVQRVPVSARYETITKQVVADPGGVEEVPVPAQYRTVTVEDVMPARASAAHNVPPVYKDVSVNVPVEDDRWEWRRVVCEPGTRPASSSGHVSSSSYSSGRHHSSGTYSGNSAGIYSSGHSGSYSGTTTYGSGHSGTTGSYSSGSHSGSHLGTRSNGFYDGAYGSTYGHQSSTSTGSNSYQTKDGYIYDRSTGYYHDASSARDTAKRQNRRYRR